MRSYFFLFATLFVLALPAGAHADQFLADFRGFDYEDPNSTPGFGNVGDGYNSVGLVVEVNPALLTINDVANEYTYRFKNLNAVSTESAPPFLFVFYSPGDFDMYEDDRTLGTPGTYGVNPPNATSPSTFEDGVNILGGTVTNFVLTLDLSSGTGSFNGDIAFNRGTQSGSIPPAQLNGWTFAGLTSGSGTGTPEGYQHQVDGEIRVPDVVPTRSTTWGQVKSTYRR
jgi:hypothetical protein